MGVGRLEAGFDRAGDLPPQRYPALISEIALLGETVIADDGLEARCIEGAVCTLEVRIAQDHAHGLGVGLAEAEAARLFIEGGFRQRLLQHRTIEAKGARLIRRQRTPVLAPDLLQTVGIDLAEIIDRDFGAPDRRDRRLAKAPENVGDAPDPEADDQHAHDQRHDAFAEPV